MIVAGEFDGQFECLIQNTEEYITLLMPTKRKNEIGQTVTYKKKIH